jgi:hypothetical protein
MNDESILLHRQIADLKLQLQQQENRNDMLNRMVLSYGTERMRVYDISLKENYVKVIYFLNYKEPDGL